MPSIAMEPGPPRERLMPLSWWVDGAVLAAKAERQRLSAADAFSKFVGPPDADGHQRWLGPWDPFTGHGKFHHRGSFWPAHWFALEQSLGRPMADGMRPLHSCVGVPKCVAPEHSREGPEADYRGEVPRLKPPIPSTEPHICPPGCRSTEGAYRDRPMYNPRTGKTRRRNRWYSNIKIPGTKPVTVRISGSWATAQEAHAEWAKVHRELWTPADD